MAAAAAAQAREAETGRAAHEAAAGAQARYVSASVTDPAALKAVFATVRSEWGPIRGLVHGAGVLADRKIAEQTDAQFDLVWNTKVE
ncbi:MAG: SDR family oxidoreductase, partial [Rhodospirillales bacterium]|nr:SDR family oxidoreductase [Rhodospirillales bacterium]